MAFGLQSPGDVEPHRFRDAIHVLALGHTPHAVNADPGHVVAAFVDECVIMSRLEVAER
jgi:hypothetical protein